jgi:hypothetical protein
MLRIYPSRFVLSFRTDMPTSYSFVVAFVDPNGMGYAQGNFKLLCTCGFEITKASLGLYKFAKNLVETNIPDAYLAYAHISSLSKSLH